MKSKFLTASALAATMTFGAVAPALADGAASTRNIIIGGAAAAVLITNYNPKNRTNSANRHGVNPRTARISITGTATIPATRNTATGTTARTACTRRRL
jgi:hypothetical protein